MPLLSCMETVHKKQRPEGWAEKRLAIATNLRDDPGILGMSLRGVLCRSNPRVPCLAHIRSSCTRLQSFITSLL